MLSMDTEIIIVSGLPRCGTSLMMQMLANGGIEVVADHIRSADTDNPRGYYEFERVKKIKQDASWLPDARGKAVKMVSQLMYDLPSSESYRIIFMDRDMDEMLDSQEKMLTRLGRKAAPREEIKAAFAKHLERLFQWLGQQPTMKVLRICYNDLLQRPEEQARLVREFVGGKIDLERMIQSVDRDLYRNRKESSQNAAVI
jgi:sulfotransferase family protein